jgi:hypothetical protein
VFSSFLIASWRSENEIAGWIHRGELTVPISDDVEQLVNDPRGYEKVKEKV